MSGASASEVAELAFAATSSTNSFFESTLGTAAAVVSAYSAPNQWRIGVANGRLLTESRVSGSFREAADLG